MDNAEQILKTQIGELVWNNAVLLAEYNKLKKQLEDNNGPTSGEPTAVA